MWMNSYLLDSLICDQLVDARDRAAKHELLRGIRRPRRARRPAWGAWLRAFVASGASAGERGPRRLRDEFLVFMTVIVVSFFTTACGPSTTTEFPSASGRRIQGASMVADGSVPVRLGAYELLFADTPGAPWQARRAALLVDLAAGQGLARGLWKRVGQARPR